MAIKNTVSSSFRFTFIDSINVFDCRLSGVRYLPNFLKIFFSKITLYQLHIVNIKMVAKVFF